MTIRLLGINLSLRVKTTSVKEVIKVQVARHLSLPMKF